MSHGLETKTCDLFVVGAGPTGISIGAAAQDAGLSAVVVDRGPLVAALVDYPAEMLFFTTRERLEIAGVPFAIPEEKPNRRQAIAYYQAVAASRALELRLHEEVVAIERDGDRFGIVSRGRDGERTTAARAVAVATGYFTWPRTLGVPGEERPWVHVRYREAWAHFGEAVVVVGGGNSGAEAALDLWRRGARVTLVHRHCELKPTIKYWVKPDLENRIEEGSIAVRLSSRVVRFDQRAVVVERNGALEAIPADACYVLVGYRPDLGIAARVGVEVDAESGVPRHDPDSCESNVPGLYVAGTIQAGNVTNRIFIENSRDHGDRIVRHLISSGRVSARVS